MDETIVLGHEAKIKVFGNAFAVRRGRLRITADRHETGDTESGRFKRHKGGRAMMELDVEAYEDTSVQPHNTPLFINEGDFVYVEVYDKGLDHDPYFANFVVSEIEIGIDVDNPNSFRFVGASDDEFTKPNTA